MMRRFSWLWQKVCYKLRFGPSMASGLRRAWWCAQGARIGRGTAAPPIYVSWPHQISIGQNCRLEHGIYFKFDGPWMPGPSIIIGDHVFVGVGCEFNITEGIVVGNDALIASGCRFIDHDHAMDITGQPMRNLICQGAPIHISEDVWLGVNVTVLKGVTIGKGAVIGAGSVVTKSVPSCEIWAGAPARRIGVRE